MTSRDDHPGEVLADLQASQSVRLEVGESQYTARARQKAVGARELLAVVETSDDELLRIRTEWVHGWLDPLVDEYVDGGDRLEPVGTLSGLELVEEAESGP
jgi:hypothetical protein